MRNIRWSGAMVLAAVLMARSTAAADRPVHEIQITATRYAFDPVTIQVTAGESVRIVIRSKDGVHGFSIPQLKIDAQVPKSREPVSVEFTAPPASRPLRDRVFRVLWKRSRSDEGFAGKRPSDADESLTSSEGWS